MPLQGQCHETEMFFEGEYILISTFCVCADGFQGLSKAFHYYLLHTNMNFLFVSLKLPTNFENAYWKSPENSFLWLVDVI